MWTIYVNKKDKSEGAGGLWLNVRTKKEGLEYINYFKKHGFKDDFKEYNLIVLFNRFTEVVASYEE